MRKRGKGALTERERGSNLMTRRWVTWETIMRRTVRTVASGYGHHDHDVFLKTTKQQVHYLKTGRFLNTGPFVLVHAIESWLTTLVSVS